MLVENLSRMAPYAAIDRLSLGGGFSNLAELVQRLADLSGLPCRVSTDHEVTLRGAAYLAAGKPDQWKTEAGVEYRPTSNPSLTVRFQQWREAMGGIV